MILERSFNRFDAHSKNHEIGILTAFRSGRKLYINRQKNKALLNDIKSLRLRDGSGRSIYGITRVDGWYQEEGRDRQTKDESYLIVNLHDLPNFKEKLKDWARKYEQDSIYYAPAGGKARLIWTSPRADSEYEYGTITPPSTGRAISSVTKDDMRTIVKHRAFADDIPWEFHKDINESTKYKHSFNQVYESYFSRYTAGLFGMGDVVEFDKAILNDPMYKALAPDMQSAVQQMVEASLAGDAIIAVAKTDLDQRLQDQFEPATITIAYSQGGGMYFGHCTIPGSLGKYMKRTGDVYQHIPQRAIKVHDGGTREPVDMEAVKQAWKTGHCTDVRANGNPPKK